MMYIPQIGIFFSFLVASNALGYCKEKCSENVTEVTLSACLKSEVLLPCYFENDLNTTNKAKTVRWTHMSSLLEITQDGNSVFDNPREGRVTVFPNLANVGNFSILIYDLQTSDLGTYSCEMNRECWRVEITELVRPDDKKETLNPWIFFAAGLFFLLFITFWFLKICENCVNRSFAYVNEVQSEVLFLRVGAEFQLFTHED